VKEDAKWDRYGGYVCGGGGGEWGSQMFGDSLEVCVKSFFEGTPCITIIN
jgi:hypothetical protein